MKIKICGLMREQDVRLCGDMSVDIAGFVTEYPVSVPWNLTREEAALLIKQVRPPMKSCVVTGGEREKVLSLLRVLRPDYVQLHFRETISDVLYITENLSHLKIGVIKTLPFSKEERLYQFGTDDVKECTRLLNEAGVCAILADSRTHDNAAKESMLPDFEIYREIRRESRVPVILAGGITPHNIGRIIESEKPQIVDIMTGVETCAGIKDKEKLCEIAKFR